jgi:hypothetical protein
MYNTLDAGMLGIPGTILELAPLAAKYGFAGISLPKGALLDPRQAEEAGACARDHGLQWGLLHTQVGGYRRTARG